MSNSIHKLSFQTDTYHNFRLSLKMLKINLFIKQTMFYSSDILHDFSI